MLRTITSVLAAGVLAISAAACSANGQSGCSQPPVQTYSATLVNPAPGAANVPDNVGVIKISTSSQALVGTFTLVPSSGPSITLGAGTLDSQQGNPSQPLWDVKIPVLQAHMAYTLKWTVTYPGGCLSSNVVHNSQLGGFTTQ